ncbi:MAG TPA: dienelactone hydrolase family protein [Novosphingobium sp.]|nr:dienelactone hydrolase family protein [Novosphingobium sp.]
MCDDHTEADASAALAARGLTRRDFAAIGSAAVLAACTASRSGAQVPALSESLVEIATADGTADAFFVHPARGRHPAVIVWPDIAGLREAKRVMARRLAAAGHAVLVVNQYYRSARAPVMESFAEWQTEAGRARLQPMIPLITPEAVERDTRALAAWLDRQPAVDTARGIGAEGYCMGGRFAVRSTHAVPGRVRAAASFHGGGLATDKPDSPHLLLASTRASYLIAVARNDDERNPQEKETFRAAAMAAGRPAEIEVYNADHGWCVPDSPVSDAAEADRAFARLLALYAGL